MIWKCSRCGESDIEYSAVSHVCPKCGCNEIWFYYFGVGEIPPSRALVNIETNDILLTEDLQPKSVVYFKEGAG